MCLSKSFITSVRRSSFLGRTAGAAFKGRSNGKRTGPATAGDSSFPPPGETAPTRVATEVSVLCLWAAVGLVLAGAVLALEFGEELTQAMAAAG